MLEKDHYRPPSTVSLGGTWFKEGDSLVLREGNVHDGKAICYHCGDGVLYTGDPKEKMAKVLMPDPRLRLPKEKKTVFVKHTKEVDNG